MTTAGLRRADPTLSTNSSSSRAPRWVLCTLAVIGLGAFVATWAGWVGLGGLTGFGKVNPLPGIWSDLEIDTAITLPLGIEAYAFLSLGAWLSGWAPTPAAARFAMWSGLFSIVLGMSAQVAYHLLVTSNPVLQVAGEHPAPWGVTLAVACIPNTVLAFGSVLAHLIRPAPPAPPADLEDPSSELETASKSAGVPVTVPTTNTYLYRLFNEAGDLLYVGVTCNLVTRLAAHRRQKSWWGEVSETTVTRFPTRLEALAGEVEAIAGESPKYNKSAGEVGALLERDGLVPRDVQVTAPALLELPEADLQAIGDGSSPDVPPSWSDLEITQQARAIIEQAERDGQRVGRHKLMDALNVTEHRAKTLITEVRTQLAQEIRR